MKNLLSIFSAYFKNWREFLVRDDENGLWSRNKLYQLTWNGEEKGWTSDDITFFRSHLPPCMAVVAGGNTGECGDGDEGTPSTSRGTKRSRNGGDTPATSRKKRKYSTVPAGMALPPPE